MTIGVALLLRCPDLGNPQLDLDEQMYLLMGDRMWHGMLPYVDIWDRKPIGLFLLYALARGFGGNPYMGYQLLALAFTTATALVVTRLVRAIGGGWVESAAGALTYLVWTELIGGRGGQSPIFYNLPMALAAWAMMRTLSGDANRPIGRLAMLLVGVAIQIKPTAIFEGCWFGLMLLAAEWRRDRSRLAMVREAVWLIGAAMLPTLIAMLVYAALGHGRAWWFANIDSIFLRAIVAGAPIETRLSGLALALAIPLLAALRGVSKLTRELRLVIGGWLAMALVGFAAMPPYFNHYTLPVVLPMSVLAGVGAIRSRPLAMLSAAAGVALLLLAGLPAFGSAAAQRARLDAMTRTIQRYRGTGCLYVFQAEPVFYVATRSCLPTRYPFSPHLTDPSEARAIGTDQAGEVARTFARAPTVVVTIPPDAAKGESFAVAAKELSRHYHPVGDGMGYVIYARNALTRPVADASPPA